MEGKGVEGGGGVVVVVVVVVRVSGFRVSGGFYYTSGGWGL